LTREIKRANISALDWNDLVNEVFVPMDVQPVNEENYRAAIDAVRLGPLSLAKITADAEIVQHPASHQSRTQDRRLFLHLQLQGRMGVSQGGHQVWLEPGDISLADSAIPFTLEHRDRCSVLVVTIPFDQMKQHLPNPEQMAGRKFPGDQGFSQTLSLMLRSLWSQAEQGRCCPEIADRAARHLLDMLTTSWLSMAGVTVADSAAAASRRIQVCRYIEANLRDPELTTRSVAAAFRISTRYLHMVFAEQGETVSGYILRRRLEQCAKQFGDPLWNKRTITEIAFGWGFNNATHFARVFRNTYGQSPRDFRLNCRNAQLAAQSRSEGGLVLPLSKAVA
jgi:AraC-like DNA-binding protein